jgi:hypothetical protein
MEHFGYFLGFHQVLKIPFRQKSSAELIKSSPIYEVGRFSVENVPILRRKRNQNKPEKICQNNIVTGRQQKKLFCLRGVYQEKWKKLKKKTILKAKWTLIRP